MVAVRTEGREGSTRGERWPDMATIEAEVNEAQDRVAIRKMMKRQR
jgi:hypothetical protein